MAFDFTEFPVLTTDRLHLIEIKPHHLADIFRIFGDERVTQFYNVETLDVLDDAKPIIDWFTLKYNDKKGIRWGIALKGSETVIGTIGINNFTWGHKGIVGYDINYGYWGQGYCSEALKEVVAFGFEAFGLNRLEAEVMIGNTASGKVLENVGFAFEGTLRQWLYWGDKWYDMNMYSVLRTDLGLLKG